MPEQRQERLPHSAKPAFSNAAYSADPRIRFVLQKLMTESPPPALDVLAASVNLSCSRFRHLFRDEMGISFAHYLKFSKLSKAKDLMEHSFLEVKQVVALSGLKDLSHAVRDFKRTFGITPLQARKFYEFASDPIEASQKCQSSAKQANGQQITPTNKQFR